MEVEKRGQPDVSVSVCGMCVICMCVRGVCVLCMHVCMVCIHVYACCVCVPFSEPLTLGGNFITCPSSWEPKGRVLRGPQRFEQVQVRALLLSSCVAVSRLPTSLASASSSAE